MKLRNASLLLLTICCLMLAVAPAMADTLYSNGPYNGEENFAYISGGISVSDSFTCGGANGCSVEDFHMVTWNSIRQSLTSLELQLGASSFGNNYTDQVLSPSGSTDLGTNEFGFELWQYDFSFSNVAVPNGTSWVTLSNAVTNIGGPFGWDENSGPSQAYTNFVGSIPSESFTLTGTTPEPSSIMLFGSGILGVISVLRRRLMR